MLRTTRLVAWECNLTRPPLRPGVQAREPDRSHSDPFQCETYQRQQGQQRHLLPHGSCAAAADVHPPFRAATLRMCLATARLGFTVLCERPASSRASTNGRKVPSCTAVGFGEDVREAGRRRLDFLAEIGLAQRRGDRIAFARNLLATLRTSDLTTTGRAMQERSGLVYRHAEDGLKVAGVYSGHVELASGRFAVLKEGAEFSLVPWKLSMAGREGQRLEAVVRAGFVDWELARQRGIGL